MAFLLSQLGVRMLLRCQDDLPSLAGPESSVSWHCPSHRWSSSSAPVFFSREPWVVPPCTHIGQPSATESQRILHRLLESPLFIVLCLWCLIQQKPDMSVDSNFHLSLFSSVRPPCSSQIPVLWDRTRKLFPSRVVQS